MQDYFQNELTKGDIIMIAFSNRLHPGIYVKQGSADNINYIPLHINLDYWLSREDVQKGKKFIQFAYINTQGNKRVIKLSIEQLTEEYKTKYLTIINLVKQGLLYKNI